MVAGSALKVTQETADATQSFALGPDDVRIVTPEFALPPGGLNIRWPDPPNDQEYRLQRYKIDAARAFARANSLNRTVIDSRYPRFGIVTTGKAHLDVLQALEDLGIEPAPRERGRHQAVQGRHELAARAGRRSGRSPTGLEEILVVEEKRGVVEEQLKEQLYNWEAKQRPLIIGKRDERGEWLLPSTGELTPALIARVLARRMRRFHSSTDIEARVRFLEQQERRLEAVDTGVQRLPHFCSGCPHNTSTRVPEGSRAVGGIGCHFMAAWMDRDTVTYTQMGGEGATWIGQAPFTTTPHVFQNLGDGTYAHSGILAIRAAVAAGVNITYKILFNDAVAMTGGQPVEGHLTVARVAQQLAAEGVRPIMVVTDEPQKYAGVHDLPAGRGRAPSARARPSAARAARGRRRLGADLRPDLRGRAAPQAQARPRRRRPTSASSSTSSYARAAATATSSRTACRCWRSRRSSAASDASISRPATRTSAVSTGSARAS